jgi:hypothetical protein
MSDYNNDGSPDFQMGIRPIPQLNQLAWLDSQSRYAQSPGRFDDLEPGRIVQLSDNYYSLIVPIPPRSDIVFNNRETKEFSIKVPPLSYLVWMTSYYGDPTAADGTGTHAGFQYRIYDKGAQNYLMEGEWAKDRTIATEQKDQTTGSSSTGDPYGPYFPRGPYIVLRPGLLQVEITSLDEDTTRTSTIQVCCQFAVPLSSQGRNNPVVVPLVRPVAEYEGEQV